MRDKDSEEVHYNEVWAVDQFGDVIPGTGRRCIHAKRCKESSAGGHLCIGVMGHLGVHWHYDELGWYNWWIEDNPDSDPMDIAAGITPCGHKNYIAPDVRYEDTYNAHAQWIDIEED